MLDFGNYPQNLPFYFARVSFIIKNALIFNYIISQEIVFGIPFYDSFMILISRTVSALQ